MKCLKLLCWATLVAFCPPNLRSQSQGGQIVVHESISGDLSNVLAKVAYSAKVPIVGELGLPLPTVDIPKGNYTLSSLSRAIAEQAPGYKWEIQGPIILFYNAALRKQPANFLNLPFPHFIMPSTVSNLKYILPNLENGLLEANTRGILLTGFGDYELEKDPLTSTRFDGLTGREILIKAATERPTFDVIVIFTRAKLLKASDSRDAAWYWQSFRSQLMPIYPPNKPHR